MYKQQREITQDVRIIELSFHDNDFIRCNSNPPTEILTPYLSRDEREMKACFYAYSAPMRGLKTLLGKQANSMGRIE